VQGQEQQEAALKSVSVFSLQVPKQAAAAPEVVVPPSQLPPQPQLAMHHELILEKTHFSD
jgi:hypothetical protein